MIEFKFSCPNCSQHIQCTDAYSGTQIVCPTCKNQIIVPQAPMVAPPSRATTPISPTRPAPPVPAAATAAPHAAAAPSAALPPRLGPKKTSKKKLLVIGGVAAFLCVCVVAYVFISSAYLDSGEGIKSEVAVRPAAKKPASVASSKPATSIARPEPGNSQPPQPITETPRTINTQSPSAEEILQRVTEKYDSLTSYSASGTAVSIIDMSGVDPNNLPGLAGKVPKAARDSKQFKEAFSKPQRTSHEFSLKLGKPDFYLVQWEGQMGPAKTTGAVWSSGDGDFLLMEMGKTRYVKMQSRDLALASATGLSGGAANTMPHIFFDGNANLLDSFKKTERYNDESIDGDDCYVLSGLAMGMKILLWIDKESHLIKQKQQLLGSADLPEATEEQIQDAIKQLGGNPTPEQEAQIRDSLKNMKAMTAQMKGSMTETYRDIQINQPVNKSEFKHDVPPGTELSSSLF